MFVDHRPGPSYGHVHELGIGSGSGDTDATPWATGLSSLFDQLADAVERRTPLLRYSPRLVQDPDRGTTLTSDVQPAR